MKIEADTATYRYSQSLRFWDFPGGDFGQFPRHVFEFVEKRLGIRTENVAMVLIKVLPNIIQLKNNLK